MNALSSRQLILVFLAGWVNRQKHDMIAYIQEENWILRARLNGTVLGRNVLRKATLAVHAMT